MREELLAKLQEWHDTDEFLKIAETVRAQPGWETDPALSGLLARALNNLGEYEEAERELMRFAREGKDDPIWHYRLAYSLYYQNKIRQAKEELEAVCRLDPGDQDAHRMLGWCCGRLGEDSPYHERGATQADFDPECYTQEEMEAVENHVSRCFGEIQNVFHEVISPDIHVDLLVVEPTRERDFYTLVTMGMGAHRMAVPQELRGEGLERAEVAVCLPADWKIQSGDERFYWPLRWLKVLARLPGQQDTWLGWGHTVPNGEPFADNTELCGVMLTHTFADEGAEQCALPDGSTVNFYQMIPLYREEMDYKVENGAQALLERMGDHFSPVVDICRYNCCAGPKKDWAIPPEKIRELLTGWEGPAGCLATDRILVDGCRVGYMYREEPDEGRPDSGWRFLAGDESDEYLENPHNSGIYSLNTLCNSDPDILPLLDSPYGTAYFRDEDTGEFIEEQLDGDE